MNIASIIKTSINIIIYYGWMKNSSPDITDEVVHSMSGVY
jgi:hypothetical protein